MHDVGYIGFDVYFSKLPDPRISRKKLVLAQQKVDEKSNEITAVVRHEVVR